jgi:hypothetical protein
MNAKTSWEEYCGRIDELLAANPERYGSRYEAGLEVKRRYPHLVNAKPGEAVPAKSAKTATGNPAPQLNAVARQIAVANGIGFYEAYVEAVAQRPELYEQYLRKCRQ